MLELAIVVFVVVAEGHVEGQVQLEAGHDTDGQVDCRHVDEGVGATLGRRDCRDDLDVPGCDCDRVVGQKRRAG